MKRSKCKWVRLGDYTEVTYENNRELMLDDSHVIGISTSKQLISTKANLNGVNLASYKLFRPKEFAYVTDTSRRGEKISLGFNNTNEIYLVSSVTCVFRILRTTELLPEYLYLIFNRTEFDRYSRYNSWGSAREFFVYDDIARTMIPLPSLEEQKKVVNAWKALREIKELNEAIAAPLMQVCQSYIQELKHKYESVEIGPYINRIDKRNSDNAVKVVKSVSVLKVFNDTNAKVDKNNLTSYKVVEPNQISFVQTTGNEKCLCAAINQYDYPVVVTSVNEVFETDPLKLSPNFLHLWFRRTELDRYARFHSWGSARETFTWDDMQRVRIPLPPIDVQQSIVNLYNCANEAKKIAEEADKKSREICPALIQYVINK